MGLLKLTKRADYGMMAMRYLAEHTHSGPRSAKDIAESCHIPFPVMAKTLQTLMRAQLITSQHGPTGGYVLGHAAYRISTLDVINAFDRIAGITSSSKSCEACNIPGKYSVQEPLAKINDRIRRLLEDITIADLTAMSLAQNIQPSDGLARIVPTEQSCDIKPCERSTWSRPDAL